MTFAVREVDILGRIDIVNMRRFMPNEQAVDIALPVLAYECEASLPIENALDAYEEAALKLVSIGLSVRGIASALNAQESMIERILSQLEDIEYIARKHERPWQLTEHGEAYLDDTIQERTSSESQYGYMFVNAIKREVLPYFYLGDVGQIPPFSLSFDGSELPLKLTESGDEGRTFTYTDVRRPRFRDAYRKYFELVNIAHSWDAGDLSRDEAQDEALLLLDDAVEVVNPENSRFSVQEGSLNAGMAVRVLKTEPRKLYLRMRMVIDPKTPGGYRVEAPFDLGGIDDGFFFRQIQWLEQSESVLVGNEGLSDFIEREITKFGPRYTVEETDFTVFVIERMPSFRASKDYAPDAYEMMKNAYAMMQSQPGMLEKENIVGSISRRVVERLVNTFFYRIGVERLGQIKRRAQRDIAKDLKNDKSGENRLYKQTLCDYASLTDAVIRINIKNTVGQMQSPKENRTNGNNVYPKIVNLLVVNFYSSNDRIGQFFDSLNGGEELDSIKRISDIRNKVSHDTENPFTSDDYDEYTAYVFHLIEKLSSALWGERKNG